MFSCPPSLNKNTDLENWNSNIWRLWCREQVNTKHKQIYFAKCQIINTFTTSVLSESSRKGPHHPLVKNIIRMYWTTAAATAGTGAVREHITCSRHQSLQIFEFQFSKSLFLFIEGGQENIFYWSKIFFGPMKNVFLSPFNK